MIANGTGLRASRPTIPQEYAGLLADQRDLRVDQLLTNISIAYRNLDYIADTIFPILEVTAQSGYIPRFKRSHWFRSGAHLRGPGTASRGGSWAPDSNLEYFVPRFSYRDELDDETVDGAADVYDVEETSVEFVTNMMQLKREISFADNFFTTTKWAEDLVAGTDFVAWDDLADANPMIDLTTWIDNVEMRIGVEPMDAVMGKQVWNVLRWHTSLLEAIKYTQTGVIDLALASRLLGVPRIHVGRAIKTDDPEGTDEADVDYERIWGPHVLLLYVPDAPGLRRPASGYTLVWNRVPSAIQWIKRMRNEEREIDIIEGNSYFRQYQTSDLAGTFAEDVVSAA